VNRPKVVVGFCRDWIGYADWLEAELDRIRPAAQVVVDDNIDWDSVRKLKVALENDDG
jgi:hypothetical protein